MSKQSFRNAKSTKSPFTYEGYQKLQIVTKKAAEQVMKKTFWQKFMFWRGPKIAVHKKNFEIYCGPIKNTDKKLVDLLIETKPSELHRDYRKLIEEKYMPTPQLTVVDHQDGGKALTAAEADEKRVSNSRWMPMYFQNVLQGYDYIVYESLLKNTLLGVVMRTVLQYIMGTGFNPELELKQPTGNKKTDAATLEAGKQIIIDLKQLDRAVSKNSDTGGIDISFKQKITNMIGNMLAYNRSCGVFVYDTKNPVEINGEKYSKLPVNVVDFHPSDMGMVKISPLTKKMESVQINQIQGFVKTTGMMYFWNSESGAIIKNAKYYGGSMMMPMINPARLIQNQISNIWPAISENMAGGLYHIFIEPQGGTEEQKQAEYESITEATEFGTSNVFMISPDRVLYENVNFDPKIGDLSNLFEMVIKYIIALAQIPQIGFFDEAAANHATAVEKIQLTISTIVNPKREWIGEDISAQWYNPMYEIIYADNKKFLETYRIKTAFDDWQVETLKERIEGLKILEEVVGVLKPEKREEIVAIEGLADNIDEAATKERDDKNESKTMEVKSGKEKFTVTTHS